MILFHGSNVSIDTIDLTKSKPNKDFGRAFYLSPDLEQAKQMASFKVDIWGGNVIVSQFEIDTPIANDRIGAQITRYKQGYITFDEFLNRIRYIKGITFQYAFCSQKAIDRLKKI